MVAFAVTVDGEADGEAPAVVTDIVAALSDGRRGGVPYYHADIAYYL
jgi:hypothetical protein